MTQLAQVPPSLSSARAAHVLSSADIYQLTRQHRYAVLVVFERTDGSLASQTYANLGAAGRKIDRVRARNLMARAVLVELKAVTDASLALGGDV